MKHQIVLNGRFLMGPAAGVGRVAEELIRALDALLQEDPALRERFQAELYAPKRLNHRIELKAITFAQGGVFGWIPWEQFDLPRRTPGATHISLCNLGPLVSRNAMTMFHDAQVYTSPGSYSRLFRMWYKFIQPLLGRRHNRILTVSNHSKRELAAYGVAPESKISVIHNGVDHVLRATSDTQAPATFGVKPRDYVLALANTQAHKNIRVLLEAFREPRLADTKLVLFGPASKADLEEIAGAPLSANVVVAGKVSDAQLRGLIENALCLAFPSKTEGFGLPPLEAMLLGCPAIVAPCGALPEVCGDATMYADPEVPADWAMKIATLKGDGTAWQAWSAKGKAHAAQYSWRRAALKLLDLF